jgi:hypothetical protein
MSEIDKLLKARWSVGQEDQGNGRQEFGVITDDGTVVLSTGDSYSLALHLASAHNATLTQR